MHRILYVMGEGLDRDKLNAMLRDGTIALKLQENFQIFGAPVDLGRWTRVGFDFREPITADVAVNKSIFNGCTMHLVLALLEWIAGHPRTRRTCSVGNAKATCCGVSSCSLRRDPCYAGTRSKSTLTLHRCTRM